MPTAAKFLRLGFHDCLKYTDGTGGCDGCVNWAGVGERFDRNLHSKELPDQVKTNNNGLEKVIKNLEDVYTETHKPWGTPKLSESLKESGKSRADLWAFAAIAAVEYGMEMNNIACDNEHDPRVMNKTCMIGQGDDCKIIPGRKFKFQSGRIDCVEHDTDKTYKATKEESHPSTQFDGRENVEWFKKDFNFTGRETAAIFGAHTYGKPKVGISLLQCSTWTSRRAFLFNNEYYKNIVGLDKTFINSDSCKKIGDAYSNMPNPTRWVAKSNKLTQNGGPTFWIHQYFGCNNQEKFPESSCFKNLEDGMTCQPDEAVSGLIRQNGEDDANLNRGCEAYRRTVGQVEIALNCEMGLYKDFKAGRDGVLHGCKGLEHFNASMQSDDKKTIISKQDGDRVTGEPQCGKQMLQEPAGSTPLYQVMEEYAADQTAWINDYIPTMEKMMRNGYDSLTDSDEVPDDVVCPLPKTTLLQIDPCYVKSAPNDGPSFMIGSRISTFEGMVYQYNEDTEKFDFDAQTGESNQLWRLSESGTQLINMLIS